MSKTFDLCNKKVWISGSRGLVGQSLIRRLQVEDCQIITTTHAQVDLRDKLAVEQWFETYKPDVVIHTAAKVGGIEENNNLPVDFLYDNLMINTHVIHACAAFNVQKLINLGSSCFYPTNASQPISEESLLTSSLERTNEAFALAKISAYKLAEYYRIQHDVDFISAVPANLYGPNDHFDLKRGHVIPSLFLRFYEAIKHNKTSVTLWGSGRPEREFLYVDDATDGIIFLLKNFSDKGLINISGGETVSIKKLSCLIAEITGFKGDILWDKSKPDGMMKKSLDNQKIAKLGWSPSTSLLNGLILTNQFFLNQQP